MSSPRVRSDPYAARSDACAASARACREAGDAGKCVAARKHKRNKISGLWWRGAGSQ